MTAFSLYFAKPLPPQGACQCDGAVFAKETSRSALESKIVMLNSPLGNTFAGQAAPPSTDTALLSHLPAGGRNSQIHNVDACGYAGKGTPRGGFVHSVCSLIFCPLGRTGGTYSVPGTIHERLPRRRYRGYYQSVRSASQFSFQTPASATTALSFLSPPQLLLLLLVTLLHSPKLHFQLANILPFLSLPKAGPRMLSSMKMCLSTVADQLLF